MRERPSGVERSLTWLPRGRKLLRHYLQGLLMGGADVIPGVSGGTIALIVGIYQRLIDSIGHAAAAAARTARGDVPGVQRHLASMEWALLLPLGAGIATALIVAARFIPDVIEAYPVETRAFFFGMISVSILIPWRRIRARGALTVLVLLAGAAVGFLVTGLPERDASDPGPVRVFVSAMIAICAMILPGVSGAFLLVVLGIYERSLQAIDQRELVYIATFMAGAATGLGLFSTLLRWLLARAHDLTMAALVGLMGGSLRALWPYIDADRSLRGPVEGEPVAAALALMGAGMAFVALLVWLGERAAYRRAAEADAAGE